MTEIIYGKELYSRREVTTNQYDRRQGTYILGSNGTGKSVLISNLAIQDIEMGMGICVLDPHGDLLDSIIARIPATREQDVIYLDPVGDTDNPFPLNLFYCPDTTSPAIFEQTVEQVIQVFSKVWGMSSETPRLNQFVRNIALTLIGTEYTMVEIPHLLLDSGFRARVLANVSNRQPSLFWQSFNQLRPTEQLDRSESTLDRIDSLISNSIIRNIVGQSDTLNFREIMDNGKILLVKLNASYEALSSLLGAIIIGQLLLASLSRIDTKSKQRRQFRCHLECCVIGCVSKKRYPQEVRNGFR